MISDRTANVIIAIVTAVWVANILAGMFELNNYEPSEAIHGIFMVIVGGALGLRNRGNDGKSDGGGGS